jgi:putative CocE/NonD family hydrolase
MKKITTKHVLVAAAVILLGVATVLIYQRKAGETMISTFGRYQGYSQKAYDGNKRTSEYLTLSNGTRLAYDVYLPTKNGVPASEPLPVLFRYTPYGRAWKIYDENGNNLLTGLVDLDWPSQALLKLRSILIPDRGRLFDALFHDQWLGDMVNHGYAVVVVERPGTGASFGVYSSDWQVVAKEEDEILNWIAAQAWCNGNIGMYGDSQNAMVQLVAASLGNPHLKAILPASSPVDLYESVEFPGGVRNTSFSAFAETAVAYLEKLYVPVDSDTDGALLAQARQERVGKTEAEGMAKAQQFPFRDSVTSSGMKLWGVSALYPFMGPVNRSGTAIYMMVGWYDIFTADMFYWYNNVSVPKRLTVRPTDHSEIEAKQSDLDFGAEAARWFDYWLKGIDNGIMDEPPVHYYVQGASPSNAWQTTNQWPLENQTPTVYYFDQAKSAAVVPAQGGLLTAQRPATSSASDVYTVNYTTTTGKEARWVAVDSAHHYPDMRSNDAKALSYTTGPLGTDVQVTGHGIVHLWLATAAPDLDVFAYLEEVDASGKSTYITEGDLRATHRQLSPAPFDNMGLPFHSHNQSDLEPVPAGQPIELDFSLLPTAYRFHQGNSLRLTLAFADADNFATPILDPAPTLQLLRDAAHPSYVAIPIIQRP